MLGGYSIAFDLVQSEYGWTDEYILDNLTLRRLRQVTAAIQRRKYFEERERKATLAWQTRILASFTAAGYMTDGENPAIEAAQDITFDDIEAAQLAEARESASGSNANLEPSNGSYERFLSMFGGVRQA